MKKPLNQQADDSLDMMDKAQEGKNMKVRITFLIYTSILYLSCILKKFSHVKQILSGIKKNFDFVGPQIIERVNKLDKKYSQHDSESEDADPLFNLQLYLQWFRETCDSILIQNSKQEVKGDDFLSKLTEDVVEEESNVNSAEK